MTIILASTFSADGTSFGFCDNDHHSFRALDLWLDAGHWHGGATLDEGNARKLRDHLTAWLAEPETPPEQHALDERATALLFETHQEARMATRNQDIARAYHQSHGMERMVRLLLPTRAAAITGEARRRAMEALAETAERSEP